jgi:UDP-N-acetylglucosamine acyltransferase
VGRGVKLGNEVELKSHVVIAGDTTVEDQTVIYPFAAIGLAPQDKKYANEPSKLIIGSHNVIREYVTIHPGTADGGMVTTVGSHGLFMIGVHIAHDCVVGDHAIFANHATLAGHVEVGDHVIIGGLTGIHQFVRVGSHAMIGGMAGVTQDVIPYAVIVGAHAYLSGLNFIGLKRRGFSSADISSLRDAYRTLFAVDECAVESTFKERLLKTETHFGNSPHVKELVDFIKEESHRNLCMPKMAAS